MWTACPWGEADQPAVAGPERVALDEVARGHDEGEQRPALARGAVERGARRGGGRPRGVTLPSEITPGLVEAELSLFFELSIGVTAWPAGAAASRPRATTPAVVTLPLPANTGDYRTGWARGARRARDGEAYATAHFAVSSQNGPLRKLRQRTIAEWGESCQLSTHPDVPEVKASGSAGRNNG
jgi:hypothetical protein